MQIRACPETYIYIYIYASNAETAKKMLHFFPHVSCVFESHCCDKQMDTLPFTNPAPTLLW